MEKVKCPVCGEMVTKAKFCSNCGSLLEKKIPEKAEKTRVAYDINPFMKGSFEYTAPERKPNTTVSDEGLILIADYCKKTVATVGGDGYTEYVLYKRSESEYEVHYYSKYEYMPEEIHYAYKAGKAIRDEAEEYIKANSLTEWMGKITAV